MKRGIQASGYTILEVMIVLAVSGLTFLVAANFINGKQPQASFNTGTNEMSSRVQDIIGQVASGNYTDRQFKCSSASGTPVVSASTDQQGTNAGCIFLGKILYFEANGKSNYQIVPLAGLRLKNGQPATTLADVNPTPIVGTNIDLRVKQTIPQNLSVQSVRLINADGTATFTTFGIGFVQGLGSTQASASTSLSYKSGSQTVGIVYVPGADGTADIPSPTQLAYANGAVICMNDGTRYATVTIGGPGGKLSVATKFFSSEPPVCASTLPTAPVGPAAAAALTVPASTGPPAGTIAPTPAPTPTPTPAPSPTPPPSCPRNNPRNCRE